MAEIAMLQTEQVVTPVRELFLEVTNSAVPQTVQIALNLNNHLITGALQSVYDGRLVQVSWSKKESKYLIEAYIRYLAGVAAGVLSGLYFISATRKAMYKAEKITKKEALKRLAELVSIYINGFESITPFYPDFELKPDDVEKLDQQTFSQLVKKKLDNAQLPCTDPYIMNEYGKGYFLKEGIQESFKNICRKLITPLASLFPDYYSK